MKIAGIISEYNPFHNGHKFHIEETRRITGCDFVIAVMSGNYVQRGEPAIIDKWSRTKMALLNGIDAVIEIPTIFSSSTAETFAHCAVKLLNDTNIVDYISFGSESGNIETLRKTALFLTEESSSFKALIKKYLDLGNSYPFARQKALEVITGTSQNIISSSNNILAAEYIKALSKLKSDIQIFTVERKGEEYTSLEINSFSSATGIRKAILEKNLCDIEKTMPKSSFEILYEGIKKGVSPIELNSFSQELNFLLRSKTPKELAEILDISEGLENRILNFVNGNHFKADEILSGIKTKRYTYTRLQRALLHILLDIKTKDMENIKNSGYSPYIRVLGFRKDKQAVISLLTQKAVLPVITNFKNSDNLVDLNCRTLLDMEKKFTNIYFLGCPEKTQRALNKEYTTPVVIV